MRQYESCVAVCRERRLELVSGGVYDELTAAAAACRVRIEGLRAVVGELARTEPGLGGCRVAYEALRQIFDPADLAASAAPLSGGPGRALRTGDDEDPGSTLHELTHGRYGLAVLAMTTMWFLWYIGNYGFLGDAATLYRSNTRLIG